MAAIVKLYNRLINLQENSMVSMNVIIKTIHGRHNGTVRWTDTKGREHIRRWTERNMEEVVSELTAALVAFLFLGEDKIKSPDTFKNYPILVRYQLNACFQEYYHGFRTEEALKKWIKYNEGWLQSYERLT